MQLAFGFGAETELLALRGRLRAVYGLLGPASRRTPMGQLVKSLISSRTRDEISALAYERLMAERPDWSDLAAASPAELEAAIADVTFPDVKARYLQGTLQALAGRVPRFDLAFLGRWPVDDALAWLESLPGVGRKVSASTLNFSTLNMAAFVVDTHVLRVLRRFGLVGPRADTRSAYEAVMAAASDWEPDDLAELHFLLKRLGQTTCASQAVVCGQCPLRTGCASSAPGRNR